MKSFIKNVYLIFLLVLSLTYLNPTFAKDQKIAYSKDNIKNYFSGIISSNYGSSDDTYKYLKKIPSLERNHRNYNIQFLRTLILLRKFDQAVEFSKNVWKNEEYFFEADLILGLNHLINGDHIKSEKHFERLNRISRYNFVFQDLIGNILIAWSKAENDSKEESFKYIAKIPKRYHHIKLIQSSFLQCYYDSSKVEETFQSLINNKDYDFSRYNFFLVNYLISKKKEESAKKIINDSKKKYSSNLLIKETDNLISNKNFNKIESFFSCKKTKNVIAEFFYILSNLYSSEEDYQLSNFYLNLSLHLNEQFLPNKTLLAENYYYQKKYKLSQKVYKSIKKIGPTYSWHASKSIAAILFKTQNLDVAISSYQKAFDSLKEKNFLHYYDLANFYKNEEYFKKSVKYYSLALKNINLNNPLVSKILDYRGSSYERLGEWEKAEKDLVKSLEIFPDEPYALNYLAYSWIEKGMNLDKAMQMLKKANKINSNDGYIIDSLGWGYYTKKNYLSAEKFLRQAVSLKPLDPVINDHYADVLWMLKKDIQARYVWRYVLNLDETTKKLKEKINHKLIFGLKKI
jgi:uncharacterized protein HemY